MEKSDLAGNAVTFLHEENYLDEFAEPLIDASSYLTTAGRKGVLLSGDWRFAIDPFDTGFRQRWFSIQRGRVPEPTDWDPFEAEEAPVPSSWNLLQPELHHYEGGVWFARTIEDPRSAPDQRLVLRFGAANYCARIFLDGVFLGRHLGGSTPFFLDISEHIDREPAELMVHVENERDPGRLPCHHFDWFNYGGLHRDVALFILPQDHIRDTFIRYTLASEIVADIRTSSDAGQVRIEIPELEVSQIVEITGGMGSAHIAASPDLWSPDDPRLYKVILTFGDDRVTERMGFRTIEVRGDDILLNGHPIFLKGVCAHEDDRDMGRVTSREDIKRRYRHARALGANFLRLAHYPHHEWAAEIADEKGLLLWEEIPAYWALDFASRATLSDATNQLSELILRDRNRASVLTWGLANETADTEDRNLFMRELAKTARDLDPTRPLSAACLFNQQSLRIEDTLANYIDIVGINEYFGWYDDDIRDLSRILAAYDLGKPLVISETGCDIVAGDDGPVTRINSEAFGTRYYRNQIDVISRHTAVKGFAPWLLYDFRTERRQNPVQRGWNRKGLIAEDKKTVKQAFSVVEDFYRRK